MRVRYRTLRPGTPEADRWQISADHRPDWRDYEVHVQGAKRQPWRVAGLVSRFGAAGPAAWSALGSRADAWTEFKGTRREATEEMLGGHTFKTRQLERDRARWDREAG
jgi:hypothetical protein